jgi:hypothetical protein
MTTNPRLISYSKAFKIINDAEAIKVNGDEILYPGCDSGDKCITIVSEQSGEATTITLADNDAGVVLVNNGVELRFKDETGEWIDIMPLAPSKIK